ncbi:MAG: roadblock/LC7 domain-containing protein [Zoogloeaceae bacterium]|nr:roadblock/LC7 domain-containing protein [Zoogloeaceae bacterium]
MTVNPAEKKTSSSGKRRPVNKELCAKAGYILGLFVEKLGGIGVKSAVIATTDGFDVASVAMSEEEGAKLSALSSSISAIGDMAIKEIGIGVSHQSITIESESGYIFIMDIRHPNCPMVLSIAASKDAVLGKLIYYARQVVAKMIEA